MGWTAAGIADLRISEYDGGVVVRARSTHLDKVVQCYVSGDLVDVQPAPAEAVEFHLPGLTEADGIHLLAVDIGSGGVNYWDAAFGQTGGNRILVQTPQKLVPYLPGDVWCVYRGEAGEAQAGLLVHSQPYYPGGRRCGGFGCGFGLGGFGWDGWEAKGFGHNFGLGEFGFDCEMLSWRSEPLPPGLYPLKVTVVDEAGNESVAAEAAIELDTFARPASSLAVESYDPLTDTLVLSFTASEDI